MPKIGFPMPTAKNRFQILNLHPKKHMFKKKHGFKGKNYSIASLYNLAQPCSLHREDRISRRLNRDFI